MLHYRRGILQLWREFRRLLSHQSIGRIGGSYHPTNRVSLLQSKLQKCLCKHNPACIIFISYISQLATCFFSNVKVSLGTSQLSEPALALVRLKWCPRPVDLHEARWTIGKPKRTKPRQLLWLTFVRVRTEGKSPRMLNTQIYSIKPLASRKLAKNLCCLLCTYWFIRQQLALAVIRYMLMLQLLPT